MHTGQVWYKACHVTNASSTITDLQGARNDFQLACSDGLVFLLSQLIRPWCIPSQMIPSPIRIGFIANTHLSANTAFVAERIGSDKLIQLWTFNHLSIATNNKTYFREKQRDWFEKVSFSVKGKIIRIRRIIRGARQKIKDRHKRALRETQEAMSGVTVGAFWNLKHSLWRNHKPKIVVCVLC